MQQYKYDFSVVMSVYNVQSFLSEAIDSLISQTIGFSSIQLIIVDDGSTDRSGALCEEYAEKYPDNVKVIHKKNGGLSSARNAGLPYVEGRFVSFFDPDDLLDNNTLSLVKSFFEAHEEIDVCCIPIVFFGNQSGQHPLNNKFKQGSRVIDLTIPENAEFVLLSAATAFYRAETAKKMCFDEELFAAEDAKENIRVLIENPKYGAVAEAKYHYRKHGNSILDKSRFDPRWYSELLHRFSEWALDYSMKKKGHIPRFVRYTVMYELQWRFNQTHIPDGVLTEEEAAEYRKLLFHTASRIDDDIILCQKNINLERKLYLIQEKHLSAAAPQTQEPFILNYKKELEKLYVVIAFMRFEKDALVLEGYYSHVESDSDHTILTALVDGKTEIKAEPVHFSDQMMSVDTPVAERKYFRLRVPLTLFKEKRKHTLRFSLLFNNQRIRKKSIKTGRFAPVTDRLSASYWISSGYLVYLNKDFFVIRPVGKHPVLPAVYKETGFLLQLLRTGKTAETKAVFVRLLYHFLRPVMPDNIWLLMDKADRADDNGEAFFRYLISLGKKSGCRPVFAAGKGSPDYKRLQKTGKVVPYLSWRHKLIHLFAQHTISGYSHEEVCSPFLSYSYCYGDLLCQNKVVFLQHGITQNNVSNGLNRYKKNYALFVTATKRERDSIVKDNYGYEPEQIVQTGFPRFDLLYSDTHKIITVMPTWDRKLCGRFIPEQSRWELLPGFERSKYYQFYNTLLTDERLFSALEKHGYRIQFLVHPVFLPYVDLFKVDKRVKVLHGDVTYRKIFAESALITTDYSSVAFDFAYLKKPVIYTQFQPVHYEKGYFDYERDGFGEVEHTVAGTIDRLIEYMENDCRLKEKYEARVNDFFQYHDKKNCERVYKAIRELDKRK